MVHLGEHMKTIFDFVICFFWLTAFKHDALFHAFMLLYFMQEAQILLYLEY